MFPRSSTFIYKPYCSFLTSKISPSQHHNITTQPKENPRRNKPVEQIYDDHNSELFAFQGILPDILKKKNASCVKVNQLCGNSRTFQTLNNDFMYKKSRNQDDICLENWLNCWSDSIQNCNSNPKEKISNNLAENSSFYFNGNKFSPETVTKFNNYFCNPINLPKKKENAIVRGSMEGKERKKNSPKGTEDWNDLPNEYQIEEMMAYFQEEGPKIFSKSGWSYLKCSYKIIFENRMIGTRTETLNSYIMQINLMKNLTKLALHNPELTILRMTKDISDGSIHVRWQVHGIPRFIVPLSFLGLVDEQSSMRYIDGFSIFFMKNDGLYHRHLLMKMTPSRNEGFRNVFAQLFSNLMHRPTLRPSGLGANISNEHTQK